MKAKTFTTHLGQEIKVSSNKKNRTFTIRTNGNKYRTIQLCKEEYNSCETQTGNDWSQFLKSSDYYAV